MSKKTLLSALVVSSLSLSTLFASSEVDTSEASSAPAQTAIRFIANSKNAPQRALAISDQSFKQFPFARTNENNADQITIRNSEIDQIDAWFYIGNSSLKKVSFEGSTIKSFEMFAGHQFLEGCEGIEAVSFKGASGIELSTFLESYASRTLLQRILDRKCMLTFDMTDTGATMVNFSKSGVYIQDAIHLIIKSSKLIDQIATEKANASKAQRGWLNTFTLGLFGE